MCASWSSSSRRRESRARSSNSAAPARSPSSRTYCAARRPARSSDREVTIFDSVGFALNDFSALRYLHRLNAEQPDGGQRIDLIPEPDDPKDLFAEPWPRIARRRGAAGSRDDLAARTASLIGAPTDVGASDRGASMGPEALRVAGLHAALAQRGLDVVDCGNVSGPPNPGLIKIERLPQSRAGDAWNLEVHDAVYRELRRAAAAHSARRRSFPEHRLDLRGRAPLPRPAQAAARAVAGRACRFQHARIVARAAACTACPCPACAASGRAS